MLARLSLKFKLTTLVVILVAVGTYIFGKVAFRGLGTAMEQAAGAGVIAAAATLAEGVSPEWLANVDPHSVYDSEYARLEQVFTKALTSGYVRRVELVRYPDQQTAEYVMSLPADRSADYYTPGARERISAGSIYRMASPGHGILEMNEPGTYVGGWIPIKLDGAPVGMLTVLVDGAAPQSSLSGAFLTITIVLFILTVLSGIITYMFSASFEKTAVTDGLMGIYNHKFFKQRLEQEVARSRRYGHQTSIALLDIDFFKRVNDTYGHTTGDIVLKNLAKWIKDSCRNTDVVCRYGGEEIVLILTHTGLAGAQEFAERLRLKISQQVVRDPGENAEFRITVSVGVAQWERGIDYMTLIKRADAALYNSKHTGRNRVTIYTEDLPLEPDKQMKAGH